ncbi:SH3 domain-containing protein [Eubacteriales bacterium OttesenSCG-928-A19]|nr:SH3 domain-containing protein [Eubacteriales bacterium OttesenSCG-928-A19]
MNQKRKPLLPALILMVVLCLAVFAPVQVFASSTTRNTNYLTAEEIASGAVTQSSGRNNRYLSSEEIAKMVSTTTNTNRSKSFLTEGEVPRDASGNPLTTTVAAGGTAKVGNCSSWVNIRSGPSTGNKVEGRANLGDSLRIINWDDTNTWAYVYYANKGPGWIHGKFISK